MGGTALSSSLPRSLQEAGLVSAAIGILLYLNTLSDGFCFDDLSAVRQNQDLLPSSPWTNLLWDDFWGTAMHIEGSHKSYRPLCVATFKLNYLVHGLAPMGYHLVNVLLHGVVCYLYVQLCGVIFSEVWPALIAGLLFAVHPIHTEAVAGVVGRAELLSSLLYILTFCCYRQAISKEEEDRSGNKWLALSLTLCLLSVLSKEQGLTAVAVCFLYDIFIHNQITIKSGFKLLSQGGTLARTLFFRGSILVIFTAAVMFLRLQIMHTTLPVFTVHDNPAVAFPSPYRQLHWLYLVALNLWLLVCPSFLCADWTMGTIPPISSWSDPRHLATLASTISLLLLSLYALTSPGRRARMVLFSLAMMVFPFLPASNLFFPVGFVVAERVLYLPSMGFCMLVAMGVWLVLKKRKIFIPIFVFCLSIYSVKTLVRNQDWKDDHSLFKSAILINPGNGKLYNNFGHDYESAGNYSYALKLFQTASIIQPDDIGAYINLGRMFKQLGDYNRAEQAYLKAIELMPSGKSFRIAPSHINVYYNLANLVKMDPGRHQEAYRLYQQAIAMKPEFVEAHLNKGDLLLQLNQTEEARTSFEAALEHKPHYTDAHYNLGTALVQLGRRKEAEQSYRRALALDSAHIHSLLGLAGLLYEEGRGQDALHLFEQVLRLDPSNVRAYFNLALLYLDKQDLLQSEAMFLKALTFDPTYRSALYNIGVLYNHQQRLTEATAHLRHLTTLYPNHLNGAQLLADCYMKTGQPALAEEIYLHVLSRSPNHVSALHNLGIVKAEGRLFEEAALLFKQALKIDPSHAPARKHLEQVEVEIDTKLRTNTNTKLTSDTNT